MGDNWLSAQTARKARKPGSLAATDEEPLRLGLYEEPCQEQVAIEEFESFAIDRLKGVLACQ